MRALYDGGAGAGPSKLTGGERARESGGMTPRTYTSLGLWFLTSIAAASAATCGGGKPSYPPASTSTGGDGGGGASTTSATTGGAGGTTGTADCKDGKKGAGETDVDCGGLCPKCADGKTCNFDTDCTSNDCDPEARVCLPQGCHDNAKNGSETDVDCGGSCAKCADGKQCAVGSDCTAGFCNTVAAPAVCATPTCSDAAKNGDETDVDCGGSCPPCDTGEACKVAADCASNVCMGMMCVLPSCIDMAKDGTETDVDCGGGSCPPCGDGLKCKVDTDCTGGFCNTSAMPPVCKSPACNDGVRNGDEADIDCGGSCMALCAVGKHCNVDADCSSDVCNSPQQTCGTPTCNDAKKNGAESDVDCGGTGVCPRCALTKHCVLASDCASQTCTGGLCVCPQGMVTSPAPGGGAFCIDQKEVSYEQYLVFYTANPPTSTQSGQCLWNSNYTPTGDWPAIPGREKEPVRFVNWCQAEAYCRYNNRHLCGSISGGVSPQGSFADANVSQWFSACSAQGASVYPYGGMFLPTNCPNPLAVDGGLTGPTLTGSFPLCQGGTPTLLDMSGNVAEWEDSCSGAVGASDTCLARGGSYQSSPSDLRCDSGGTPVNLARNYAGRDVGFRCCL